MKRCGRRVSRSLTAGFVGLLVLPVQAQFLSGDSVSYNVSDTVEASVQGDTLTISGLGDSPLYRFENGGLISAPETFDFSIKVLPQFGHDLTGVAASASGVFDDGGGVVVVYGDAVGEVGTVDFAVSGLVADSGDWSAAASVSAGGSDPLIVAIELSVLGSSFAGLVGGGAAFLEISSLELTGQTSLTPVPLPGGLFLLAAPAGLLLRSRRTPQQ